MKSIAGFTLLELLIAVAIFALISAMAYGGLQSVLDQQQETAQRAERLGALQLSYRVFKRDLEQMVERGIRNEFGDRVDALVGGSGFDGVEFTRGGYPNPAGFARSELQRVAYVPDEDRLLRRTWRVLDRAQDSEADEQVLMENVRRFSMRFLQDNNEWQERWPPLQAQEEDQVGLPKAVEVMVELEDMGTLTWLFRLPQNFVAGTQPAVAAPGEEGEGNPREGNKEEKEEG